MEQKNARQRLQCDGKQEGAWCRMTCGKCKKWINLYVDGYLPPAQEDILFAHMEECEDCARYYDDLLYILDMTEEEDRGIPPYFSERWRREVFAGAEKKGRPHYKALIPALAAALCCVFVISAVFAKNGGLLNVTSVQKQPQVVEEQAEEPEKVVLLPFEAPEEEPPQATPVPEQGVLLEDYTGTTEPGVGMEDHISSGGLDTVITEEPAVIVDTQAEEPTVTPLIVDAVGLGIKKQVIVYADEKKITVQELKNSVTLETDIKTLKELLAYFSLKQPAEWSAPTIDETEIQTIEVLCE